MFKIKSGTSTAALSLFTSKIKSLDKIPGVLKISLGPTFSTERNQGFTHALIVQFPDKSALHKYAKDPYHLEVIQEAILPIIENHDDGILAMDFEE